MDGHYLNNNYFLGVIKNTLQIKPTVIGVAAVAISHCRHGVLITAFIIWIQDVMHWLWMERLIMIMMGK